MLRGLLRSGAYRPQPGWGLNNTGPFNNLQADGYWSGTEYSVTPYDAWYFDFNNDSNNGKQGGGWKAGSVYALAVRPGEVNFAPVPEPATMLLLASGLVGLVEFRKRVRK